jgi:hypothetical protein
LLLAISDLTGHRVSVRSVISAWELAISDIQKYRDNEALLLPLD